MVLKSADCVVFVADSQEPMLDANRDALKNLRENLEANEIDPDEIPVVLQYNKRDLPNALPVDVLNEKLNPKGAPYFEAIAMKGEGVEATLKAATGLVFRALASKYGGGEAANAPAPRPVTPAPPPRPVEPLPPPVPPLPEPAAAELSTDSLLDSLEAPSPEPIVEEPGAVGTEEITEPVVGEPALDLESGGPEISAEESPMDALDLGELMLEEPAAEPTSEAAELNLEELGSEEPAEEPVPEAAPEPPELNLEELGSEEPAEEPVAETAPEPPELNLEALGSEGPVDQLDLEEPVAEPTPEPPELNLETLGSEGPTDQAAAEPAAASRPAAGSRTITVELSEQEGQTEVTIPLEVSVGDGASRVQLELHLRVKLKRG
jgi:hypothetical protein